MISRTRTRCWCRWGGWRSGFVSWRRIWPRGRAGFCGWWRSLMRGGGGRAGICRRVRRGWRGSARSLRGLPGSRCGWPARWAGLPVICSEFAAGRMSYAKVRALTRIATPQTEAGLAEITGPMTAAQCERFAAAHRTASDAGDVAARAARRVSVTVGEDGSVAVSARLPAVEGAVVLQALRAAAGDCEHPHRPHHDPAEDTAPADGHRARRGAARSPGIAPAGGGPRERTPPGRRRGGRAGRWDLPGEPGRCAGGGGRGVPVGEDRHRGQPATSTR